MGILRPLKKLAIFCHRWMGVAFCLLFSWWFVSGIFMMYWDYPGVSAEDRLERASVLDASKVKLSPQEAYAALQITQMPASLRLSTFDGRPVYHFRAGRGQVTVYADTGEQQDIFSPELNLRTAAHWTGQPASAAKVESVEEPDQWTLEGNFRSLWPLSKYSWPDGQQVYISENNGEVVQYTTTSSRLFAQLGAIPHWLYYTPLRKNGPLWSKVVIWLSGIATVAALLGLIAGLTMYSPSQRYRHDGVATSIPYSGQKRLHMILGLFFGIVACTWAFSGMLSMDPFPINSGAPAGRGNGGGGARIPGALRAGRFQLSQYSGKDPREALGQIADFSAKELQFSTFAGEPVYIATADRGHTKIIPVHGEPMTEFDHERILNIATMAAKPETVTESRLMTQYDAYYLDRHREAPLPVLYVQLNDQNHSRYYIDPKTAQVVASYRETKQSWVNRWLYHGLHSINFPWLYNHRPAWDIVVLTLLLGGSALSVTSVIIGVQLLQRKVSR